MAGEEFSLLLRGNLSEKTNIQILMRLFGLRAAVCAVTYGESVFMWCRKDIKATLSRALLFFFFLNSYQRRKQQIVSLF